MSQQINKRSLVGETISQYRVLREIGHGGMATVYEAEDTLLARHVALKVIAEDLLRDESAIARFELEARAAAALDHPNICRVYELTQYNGRPVIVMELLEGESLREAVRRGPLPLALVVDIGIEIADALDLAHTKGFLHRDIKPGNIMCNGRGQAKLLDFGLAKSGDREAPLEDHDANNGSFGGTVQFMSPEQTRGEELDARSDLFSLGIVLYEIATGERPFKRRSGLATMEAIRAVHPASPQSLNPAVPEGLEVIITKLLQKDPAERYQSAADLRSDLQALKLSMQAMEAERGRAISLEPDAIPPIAAAEPPAPLESEEQLVSRVWRRRAWYVAPFVIAALLFLALAAILIYERLSGASLRNDEVQFSARTEFASAIATTPGVRTNATLW